MTRNAPGKVATTKRVVRLPDWMIDHIDDMNIGVHASRADFILAAMREFSTYMLFELEVSIRTFEDYDDKNQVMEERFAGMHLRMDNLVTGVIHDMPEMPDSNEDTSTVMVYIPEGLKAKMEYVMDFTPSLKNDTAYARVSTWYKIKETKKEFKRIRHIETYHRMIEDLDRNVYIRELEEKKDFLAEHGVIFIDPED